MSADKLPESVTNAIQEHADRCEKLGSCSAEEGYVAAQACIASGRALTAAILDWHVAALRERERETIERCAVTCESLGHEIDTGYGFVGSGRTARKCAEMIRALLPPEEKTTPCE